MVAALYGLAVGTLANWRSRDRKLIEQGKEPIGPPWVEIGRQRLYPSDLLEAWVAARIITANADQGARELRDD
jgi:hypothetical protein